MLTIPLLISFLTIVLQSAQCKAAIYLEPLSDEMIEYINNKANASWRAGRSVRFETIEQFKQLLGTIIPTESDKSLPVKTIEREEFSDDIPEQFDSRLQWPNCSSIGMIRDQSDCGSCWAFGAVEAMSDRICIASNGQDQPILSARDLLSCCFGFGCHGGFPPLAWLFWIRNGIVTGGSYDSKSGCLPYPFPPCSHHVNGSYPPCPKSLYPTPQCTYECRDGYKVDYKEDKHYGDNSYYVGGNQTTIKLEMAKRGPLEATFNVYADFASYKSGIYHYVSGGWLGGHAIKVLGWGEENGVPFWLCANSWNSDWGEKGFFRIRRGTNECGIENMMIGGVP